MPKFAALCGIILILAVAYKIYFNDLDSEDKVRAFLCKKSEEIKLVQKSLNKTVTKVLDGVYVALNFGLANVIMLEGNGKFLEILTEMCCSYFSYFLSAVIFSK